MHLGHAYSALLASDLTQRHGGAFLLRIEDIDQSRSRPTWEAQIYQDLTWLGLSWPQPVLRQSTRLATYTEALQNLWSMGLLYPCTCNRRDIMAAASAPQEGAPLLGPDGVIYPGTCRHRHPRTGAMPTDTPLRLDMASAADHLGDWLSTAGFHEDGFAPDGTTGWISFSRAELETSIGDVVLARREMGTSYHLSVVLDDAAQKITHVVRGEDLFDATRIHVVLQALLNLPTPTYHHHDLIRDEAGKRLAKRDDARAIAKYRNDGATPADIRRMVGLDHG